MNQRSIMMIFLIAVTVIFGGILYSDLRSSGKLGSMFKKDQTENWKWDDSWNGGGPVTPSPTPPTNPVKPSPQPETPKTQIVAGNYKEALQKSGELGRPALVFFTAEWCPHCVRMKNDTLASEKVAPTLKNYVVVYVDTDKDREGVRKFGVQGLPSYVITNHKEEKLKFGSGFMSADAFAEWLNDPKLFNQPKAEGSPTPPPEQKPEENNRRRLVPRDPDQRRPIRPGNSSG